jgi:hypothetical protein
MSETLETPAIESIDDFLATSGPGATSYQDLRRFPRFSFRSCAEALIHPFSKDQGEAAHCFVLTQDLSRGGVSIIHPVQLFPGQRIEIGLGGNPPKPAVVSWCRRLPKNHFAVGCRFIGEQTPPPQQV